MYISICRVHLHRREVYLWYLLIRSEEIGRCEILRKGLVFWYCCCTEHSMEVSPFSGHMNRSKANHIVKSCLYSKVMEMLTSSKEYFSGNIEVDPLATTPQFPPL